MSTNGKENGSKSWPIIGALTLGFMLLQGFWGMAYNSITSAHDDLKHRVEWALMPKDELIERFRVVNNKLDEERLARRDLETELVSKDTFNEKWRTYEQRHEDLQKEVVDVNNKLSLIVTPTDVIHTLQSRIDRLEAEILSSAKGRPETVKVP